MTEAYCVKCKKKQIMNDPKESILKNGRRAMKGECPKCGTRMCRIMGGTAKKPGAAKAKKK